MPRVEFESRYAPCAFLIVQDGASIYDESKTVLVQTDYDHPGIASRMGWSPCGCGATDGTVDCDHKTAVEMIAEASQHISDHAGETFADLADYFPGGV